MGKYDKWSIPEHTSFAPEVVNADIIALEKIAAQGRLSREGYIELIILKSVQESQKKEKESESNV